jgi:hypothetical protein
MTRTGHPAPGRVATIHATAGPGTVPETTPGRPLQNGLTCTWQVNAVHEVANRA